MNNNGLHFISELSIGGMQIVKRCFEQNRKLSTTHSRKSERIVKFRITRQEQLLHHNTPPSDRSFTWEMVKTLLPHEKRVVEPANEYEANVLKTFNHSPDDLLEVPPLDSIPSPFVYHSTVNGDKSYITQPRLSVSKMLTSAWCELRSFYDIYAGLLRQPPLPSMRAGTKYHANLEAKEHPRRDELGLRAHLKMLLAKHSIDDRRELTRTTDAHGFAQSWLEQTVFRTICASHTKGAREIFLHGFLDLARGRLVTNENALLEGVLINGIVDIVKIDKFNANRSFTDVASDHGLDEEANLNITNEIPNFGAREVLDLTVELQKAKKRMSELAENHFFHMRDVKTRRLNTIPNQALAVNAAKLQCMYYAIFLHNLARNENFAYESCIENISRRGIDPDEPISVALATELLVANFRTIALDCIRLARGQGINFERFDGHAHQGKDYSLSQFITETELRLLIEIHHGDDLDISGFDLRPLFANWRIPLTLRYVSARTGQAFNVFEAFEPSSVCVEYHNSVNHTIIARNHYPFDMQEILQSILQSSQFWNGQRHPTHTEDPSMCNYCNFKKRCSAINSGVGRKAAKLIHELQR
ncbi:exonuclease V [Metschnikowia aff. pulcherrima]|uniref:Exonuclease V, mitochondrial n=1 Tax=Metschnikowia aff. pulcherrima TaxID=2163413 RepID=A0A4P6XMD4_9ASCO|nr:exonuclease V [Metschnikowia aff. pulcherrima]